MSKAEIELGRVLIPEKLCTVEEGPWSTGRQTLLFVQDMCTRYDFPAILWKFREMVEHRVPIDCGIPVLLNYVVKKWFPQFV